MELEKKVIILKAIYLLGIFSVFFVFFTQIHPLVIFDTDDWAHISAARRSLPLWGGWNPTRVFPEVLMPLCGDVAAFFVYPLTGNYIRSFTLVNGVVVSIFIVLYMHMFFELLYKRWRLPIFRVFLFSTIFLLLHFWVFRTKDADNEYLFYSPNVTWYYYYLIPALLNCSLVLYLLRNDVLYGGWKKIKFDALGNHIVRNSILLLTFYFALFSNLFESVILAAFVGGQLLFELFYPIRYKGRFKELAKRNVFRLAFLFAWIVAQIFEVYGGRAASFSGGVSLNSFQNVFYAMLNKVHSMNKVFLAVSIAICLTATGIGIYRHVKESPKKAWGGVHQHVAILAISELLIVGYLTLLCSRVHYINGPVIWFSILFFVFLVLMLCASYILSNVQLLDVFLPFFCCLLVFEIRTGSKTFSQIGGVNNSIYMAVDNDIVSQFLDAEEDGKNEMVLYVPMFETYTNDNFPLATYGGGSISRTLYRHGVINHPITVTKMEPTREKNKQFNLG